MNPMQQLRIAKLTLNIGAGKEQAILTKGLKLLKTISNHEPMKTITQKRIQGWGLRPGLPIGCKVTLRNEEARELLARLLQAKDRKLGESNFDDCGNVSFGIPEYIDIPKVDYDPEIGVIGLQACVTLEKAGYRVKKRKRKRGVIGKKHRVTKAEAITFMKEQFKITVGGEE